MTQTLDQPFMRLLGWQIVKILIIIFLKLLISEKVKSPIKEQINAKQGGECEAKA